MNIAIIFAGGVGSRMGKTNMPKQFLEVDGIPIMIHTLNVFEKCDEIDAISIACVEPYIGYLKELLDRFGLKKVRWISKGGSTGQMSIFNAIEAVYKDESVPKDSLLLIHDAVRPNIDETLIMDNIKTAREKGNSVTVTKCNETIFKSMNHTDIDDILNRDYLYCAKAPQCFFLKDIYDAHIRAQEREDVNNWDSVSLMNKDNVIISFVEGKNSNIKITTMEDFYIFETMYKMQKQ